MSRSAGRGAIAEAELRAQPRDITRGTPLAECPLVPTLTSCPACGGFLAPTLARCPHCDVAPPARHRLRGVLASLLLAATSAVTLMACYGVGPRYECDDGYADCTAWCSIDEHCGQGSYCNEAYGECEWGGTCGSDDVPCPDGYACDVVRSTCVPVEEPPRCEAASDCTWGLEYCDLATGACVPTTTCGPGQTGCEATEVCEWELGLCVPCTGEACGTCLGEVTCADAPPVCPEGTRPARFDGGCYTGGCVEEATCAAEACAALDEAACVVSDTCDAFYVGVGCTGPDGEPCAPGGSCTCESFVFDRCEPAPTPPAP